LIGFAKPIATVKCNIPAGNLCRGTMQGWAKYLDSDALAASRFSADGERASGT